MDLDSPAGENAFVAKIMVDHVTRYHNNKRSCTHCFRVPEENQNEVS